MPLSNIGKVFFASQYAIDRIVTPETTVAYSIIAGSPGSPQIDTHTIAHSFGKAMFITYAFSIDATNFYAQGNAIRLDDTAPFVGTLGTVNVDAAVDDNTIYFYVFNEYNNPVTVTIRYVLDNVI